MFYIISITIYYYTNFKLKNKFTIRLDLIYKINPIRS